MLHFNDDSNEFGELSEVGEMFSDCDKGFICIYIYIYHEYF